MEGGGGIGEGFVRRGHLSRALGDFINNEKWEEGIPGKGPAGAKTWGCAEHGGNCRLVQLKPTACNGASWTGG